MDGGWLAARACAHSWSGSSGVGQSFHCTFVVPQSREGRAGLTYCEHKILINPLQMSTVAEAAATSSGALTLACNRKMIPSQELWRRQGLAFIHLAVESVGG